MDPLFTNFGVSLTEGQSRYDLNFVDWQKLMLLQLIGIGDGIPDSAGTTLSHTNIAVIKEILEQYEKDLQGPIRLHFAPTPGDGDEVLERPANTSGYRFYLEENATVEFVVAPIGTAAVVAGGLDSVTLKGMIAGTIDTFDEPVSDGETIFILDVTGVAKGRWIQR